MATRSPLVQDIPVAGRRLGQTRPVPPRSSFTACGTLDKPLTFSALQSPLQYKENNNKKSRSAQSAFRGAHADLAACGTPHFLAGCGHMPWRARLSPVRLRTRPRGQSPWISAEREQDGRAARVTHGSASLCKLSPGLPRPAAQAVPPRSPWGEQRDRPHLCLTSLSDPQLGCQK